MNLKYVIKRLLVEKRPLRFIISRILFKTGLCRIFTINRKDYKIRFSQSGIPLYYWVNNDEFDWDERFLEIYLKERDVVVDIGANVGTMSLKAASIVGNKGKVFAYEPHPLVYRYMGNNITLNTFTNIEPFNYALGSENGEVTFSDMKGDASNHVIDNGSLVVPVKKLDDLLLEVPVINLMKVDVEGYEKFVFEGALESLRKTECVYFEAWNIHYEKYNYKAEDVFDILVAMGFELYKVNGKQFEKIDTKYQPLVNQNLFAIKVQSQFRERIKKHGFDFSK